MSKNNKDNNDDVIESEVIDNSELKEEIENVAPIIVKKGSFVSFVAFLFSATALTISAYLFMQQKKITEQPNDDSWQIPVKQVEQKAEQKFKQFSNQINQIQKTNRDLQQQLQNIETIATNNQPSESDETIEKYDDSGLVEQIQLLSKNLETQVNALGQFQATVNDKDIKQNQAIDQITQKLNSTQPQNNPTMRITRSFAYESAEHFLNVAYQNFSIYENVMKGKDFLNKTIEQISVLEGDEYHAISKELQKILDNLNSKASLDVTQTTTIIDDLKDQTNQLSIDKTSFAREAGKDEKEQSSWYDKLIVIRKVEDDNDKKLTSYEKMTIYNDLNNHFSTLKIALMNKKQAIWDKELDAINELLSANFSSQASQIINKVLELKTLNINPVLPDLSKYLESIQSLNNTKFEQVDILFESSSKFSSQSDAIET